MANSYKFKGVALATISETTLLTAASTETIIIRSIRVTNNTSNTPTISLDLSDDSASTEYTILKTQTLAESSDKSNEIVGVLEVLLVTLIDLITTVVSAAAVNKVVSEVVANATPVNL